MIRAKLSLIVAAVALLPAISLAAAPSASPAIPIQVVFVPIPQAMPIVTPTSFIRQINQMQQQMAMLQRMAFAVFSQPVFASTPTVPPVATMPHGMTQVSMISVSGPGGVCSEQMQILPGPNGQSRVFVRRSGDGCAPLSTALGAMPGPRAHVPNAPARPANVLPPPSKLIYADYPIPAATHLARQG